jgi:hypothetical protein
MALLSALLAMLGACAIFTPVKLVPGETEAEVVAKLGRPSARIPDGSQHLLEYSRNPWGQEIYMARFGADNRLISYEQVLTVEKFATIKPGVATKADVLRTVGHPSETMYLSRQQLEVWTYPYKEYGVWNSEMNIHFDNAGIVRKMENGQDLRFDRDPQFGFSRR